MNDTATTPSTTLTTTINRRWLMKMGAFIMAFLILGVWGTVDAFIVYPKRGRESIEFTLWKYLEESQKSGELLRASVEDPQAEFDRLAAKKAGLTNLEVERFKWLTALSRLENLRVIARQNAVEVAKPIDQRTDTPTLFRNPEAKLNDLGSRLAKVSQPKPLSELDLPSQYLFMLLGFAGALAIVFFLAKASRVKYRYEPAVHALTLPNGRRILPAEITEVDKRKWHKYFVFLKLNDNSPEIKLDLLRYTPLEDWVLEMEKLHPNYVPEEDDEPQPPPAVEPSQNAPTQS